MLVLFGLLLVGCTPESKTITDEKTSPEIKIVTPEEEHLLDEWGSDAMDRENHDYDSITHNKLVVDPNYEDLERGDVVYYKTLGRVVGLPGETVMIRFGHVYINNDRLDTFYGEATQTSATEVVDVDSVKRYFKTEMNPIQVEERAL